MPEKTKRPAHEVVIGMIEKLYNALAESKDDSSGFPALAGFAMSTLFTALETMLIPPEHVHSIVARLEVLTKREPFHADARDDVTKLIERLRADNPDAREDVEAIRRGMREGPDCLNCGFTMQPHGTEFKCPNCDSTIVTKPA